MQKFESRSLLETGEIAKNWLVAMAKKYSDSNQAALVGLSGHLGAGKTAFVKSVAKHLSINEEITSPTFVIMKIYEISHPKWRRMIHIDAYRLEDESELEILKFNQLRNDPANLIMIEWPENVGIESLLTEELKFEMKDSVCKIQTT
jgi:tRNA threonylcarbamoyl adenosine modification protein YjeE